MKIYIHFYVQKKSCDIFEQQLTRKATINMLSTSGWTLKSWPQGKETRGLGDIITISQEYKGKSIDRTIEITKFLANKKIIEKAQDPYSNIETVISLEEENNTTKIIYAARITPRFILAKLLQPWVRPSKKFLDSLKSNILHSMSNLIESTIDPQIRVTLMAVPIRAVNLVSSIALGAAVGLVIGRVL